MDILYADFTGVGPGIVESAFFRIQKIEPLNEKSVKLFFTHPVNINCENVLNYNITEDGRSFASGEKDQLIVRMVNSEEHCALLSLKTGSFKEGERYTVEISGNMSSAYGVLLNDGSGDEMSFTAVSGKVESFKLEDVIPYEKYMILLTFNKEVNHSSLSKYTIIMLPTKNTSNTHRKGNSGKPGDNTR